METRSCWPSTSPDGDGPGGDAIREILEGEGIRLRLDARCLSGEKRGGGVAVQVDCAAGDREVVGSHVLLAVGRRPDTDDLGLQAAGVEVDARGYIVVDDELRTSVDRIWALGDCNGRGGFTYTTEGRTFLDFTPPLDLSAGWSSDSLGFLVFLGVMWWAHPCSDGDGYVIPRISSCKDEIHAVWAVLCRRDDADAIREALARARVAVEDTPEGSTREIRR